MSDTNQPAASGTQEIREAVRKRYSEAAQAALNNAPASCCTSSCGCGSGGAGSSSLPDETKDFITRGLYDEAELQGVPLAAHLASLGCGNPTALAELRPGETVLDLGSGGGIDVLLSARRVGPTGYAYGLDMTNEMLQLAEKNKTEAGVTNVEFLAGQIEEIPLPDAHVDVIISNCVINLSADKDQVLREAFRVLKPGGRFAVADVVVDGTLPIPDSLRRDLLAWSGCVAGALSVGEYEAKLAAAGFQEIAIEPVRRYVVRDMIDAGYESLADLSEEQQAAMDGRVMSAFVRAVKPAASR